MSIGRAVLGLILVVLLWAPGASAQSAVTVSGLVTDGSGAVVVGATVDAVIAERPVSRATSDSDGRYSVQVPSGVRYQLLVRALGFADFVAEMSAVGAATTRDVALQVGGVSDTVVGTASRGAESRSNVTQSVSVMTAADIEALGSTSLAEVVRGAQSSLWGSDAIGSVVQVFTKRAGVSDAPQITGSLEGGSFNTFRGDTRISGGALRKVDYQAGVTFRKSDGAFQDILPEDDRFEQTAFDGSMGGKLGNNANLRTSLRYSNGQGRSVGPITYGARVTGGIYDTKDVSWTVAADHAAGWYSGWLTRGC